MIGINNRENTLTDGSKTYDVIIYDFDQENGEDRLCIPAANKEQASEIFNMFYEMKRKYNL